MENAISKLAQNIKNRVVGVVLFGYTKNKQTRSGIPGYPKERVRVFCSSSDGVCGGALLVTLGHFSYLMDGSGSKAVNFLVSQINSGGRGGMGGIGGLLGGGKGGKGMGGLKGKGGKFGSKMADLEE
jgi:cutinase